MKEGTSELFLLELKKDISAANNTIVKEKLEKLYPADIAEIFVVLSLEEQSFLIDVLDNEISAEVLAELEEDDRKEILKLFSAKEIAEEVIKEVESDDAADIIGELSREKKIEVISELEDKKQAKDIIDLLRYDKETAGGIMTKEFVVVPHDLTIGKCVGEMREQAQNMEKVSSVFVVNSEQELIGTLSLKRLLTASNQSKIANIYSKKFHAVEVTDTQEEVANYIQKYDLYEVAVIDEINRLVGRITVDDVIDIIRDEADKDYQMASGISGDIDSRDSLIDVIKARLPWLMIGMFGGVLSSQILKANEATMTFYPLLIFFVPLITATAGNVGVQSSAIVVQGLANGTLDKNIRKNLSKEISLALVSGLVLSSLIFAYNIFFNGNLDIALSISISLFFVVIVSATIGTLVPLMLNRYGIDPAIATGPFITTSNDLLGIVIYFITAKLLLGI